MGKLTSKIAFEDDAVRQHTVSIGVRASRGSTPRGNGCLGCLVGKSLKTQGVRKESVPFMRVSLGQHGTQADRWVAALILDKVVSAAA